MTASLTVDVTGMPVRQAVAILAWAAAHGADTVDTAIGDGVIELALDPDSFTDHDIPARIDDYPRPGIDQDAARARAAEAAYAS